MLPFDEFQLKQCGLIDPAGHHLNDIELKSIGRKGDPRHAQLANDIVDDSKLCDLSKSSKSITDNTKSLDSPYPRILKFDDTPILSTAEDDKAPILVEKSIEKAGRSTVVAGKSRYKLYVTGHAFRRQIVQNFLREKRIDGHAGTVATGWTIAIVRFGRPISVRGHVESEIFGISYAMRCAQDDQTFNKNRPDTTMQSYFVG
uniref:Uncharacterized protein n=1 Tax=Romanomermis culicivorax TaxID=13658 RepID=A0A915HQL0_ROMCU